WTSRNDRLVAPGPTTRFACGVASHHWRPGGGHTRVVHTSHSWGVHTSWTGSSTSASSPPREVAKWVLVPQGGRSARSSAMSPGELREPAGLRLPKLNFGLVGGDHRCGALQAELGNRSSAVEIWDRRRH